MGIYSYLKIGLWVVSSEDKTYTPRFRMPLAIILNLLVFHDHCIKRSIELIYHATSKIIIN
jgi:hypothetical protein